MSDERIDQYATYGYEWAICGGKGIPCGLETEMDFIAFNAGISNANIRHELNIPDYIPSQSLVRRCHDNRAPRSDISMQLGYE